MSSFEVDGAVETEGAGVGAERKRREIGARMEREEEVEAEEVEGEQVERCESRFYA